MRPGVPNSPVWDNAPLHRPKRGKEAARAAGTALAFPPFRSPERMPPEDPRRGRKQAVAANRCYPGIDALVERALAWLDGLSNGDRLRRRGLRSSKFDWLPT